MVGNLFKTFAWAARLCALGGVVAATAGCGTILAGPAETITIQPLASEDLASPCVFDINMPDDPLGSANGSNNAADNATKPAEVETAALVVYERADSATLFNDPQVQDMAAKLHLVTVFAHQCNSKVTGDIQSDATKGPGRALFAALSKYAADNKHAEVANTKLILSGFSAAGVLSITMEKAYPDRILTAIPYASGSAYLNLDTVTVTKAMAQIPTLILANAYDSLSGDQRSFRFFQRGSAFGAVWGFAVQNHTDHCCPLSTRDVMIPWVTALTPNISEPVAGTASLTPVSYKAFAIPSTPNVSFTPYLDGWPDAQGEFDFWIPIAAPSPSGGGPVQAWVPDNATAQAWYKWVTSPGTN